MERHASPTLTLLRIRYPTSVLLDFPVRLTAKQLIEIIAKLEDRRLPRSLLDYYETTGLLVPSIRPGSGRGGGAKTRYYSVRDVVLLRWLVRLVAQGVPLRRVREAMDHLRRVLPEKIEEVHGLRFLAIGERVYVVESDKVAWAVTHGKGQLLLPFAVDDLKKGVDRAVHDALTAA